MTVYRLTEYTSSDMGKLTEFAETLRELVSGAGALFIDVVDLGEGKAVVVAKYASQADMDAATEINKQAFGKMIEAGLVDAASIRSQSGDVTFTF